MKRLIVLILNLVGFASMGQVVTTNPAIPDPTQPVTITVDVTGTSLAGYAWNNTTAPVWIWAWLDGAVDVDAPTNVNPATSPGQDAAKCNRISTNQYQITFTPTTFFNQPANVITKIGLKLKTKDWNDGKQTDNDRFFTLSQGFAVTLSQPSKSSFFVNTNDVINITANTNQPASIVFKIAGNAIATSGAGVTTFTYQHTVTESSGAVQVVCEASNGTETKSTSFTYVLRTPTVDQPRPAGVIDGINYQPDATKVTLGLWAPGKTSVYVLGDFNNWVIDPAYQMKRDGEHFWLDVNGLTSGVEYGYQYLVGETLYVGDPYADKVLDPDDQYIPDNTYPNLKPYPFEALHSEWYYNRVSVLQTAQTPFVWQASGYQRPAKEKLTIYELLIRDFFADPDRNYQTLMDTIGYFKRMGINAIELMPVTEFNGNDSWGYNPTFMFAPDKYYGTRAQLKQFIDLCHQNDIAVILDIVMNQQDLPNPYVLMYYNFGTSKPAANNPWFNVNATHPFSVFYDLNHESSYTKSYLDTVNYHWLHDYKVDGLRFDLAKGFTQTVNTDVGLWSNYDASRIAILKRMADVIWSYAPETYVILEHFAANTEEQELVEYRAGEGKGMMTWANFNYAYNQGTMGFENGSDFSSIYHANRGWSVAHAVGYMESHDEERLMFKNLQYGNSSGGYSIKSLNTALARIKAANLLFYTIPGPKMVWEFGELGYDKSINTCPDGSYDNNCRVSAKPILWSYADVPERADLLHHTSDLARLRNTFSVFTNGTATIPSGNGLGKRISLKHVPYSDSPADSTQLNAMIVANMDVTTQGVTADFPHTGTWYDYYADGATLSVTSTSQSISLPAGGYKLYTDVRITRPVVVTALESRIDDMVKVYPNPTSDILVVEIDNVAVSSVTLRSTQGLKVTPEKLSGNTWDIHELSAGLYVAEVTTANKVYRVKVIKK